MTLRPARIRSKLTRVVREAASARISRELAYLGATAALAPVGAAYVLVLAAMALPLGLSVVGLPLVGAGVVLARVGGRVQRRLVSGLLWEEVARPAHFRSAPGIVGWTRAALGDSMGLRSLVYLLVRAPVVLVGGSVAFGGGLLGLALLFSPLWMSAPILQEVLAMVAGVAILLVVPWAARLVVTADRWLVHNLLITDAVRALPMARRQADRQAATDLRLLPDGLDLTDGIDLTDGVDPTDGIDLTDGVDLVDPARPIGGVGSGGVRVRPPTPQGVGLGPALARLTTDAPTSVRLQLDLDGEDLPVAFEALACAAATELVGNVVEHSGAGLVEVSAIARRGTLSVRVSDDGDGGAVAREGSGLGHLGRAVSAVDGLLVISSPPGGPTDITLALPLPLTVSGAPAPLPAGRAPVPVPVAPPPGPDGPLHRSVVDAVAPPPSRPRVDGRPPRRPVS